MKKFVLLFALLLPVFGFSQVDLVKWNKANYTSNNLQTGASGSTIAAYGGAQIAATSWDQTFFLTSNWPNPQFNGTGGIDTSKYIQFSVTANSDKTLNLSSLSFECRAQGNTVDYEVRFSKSSSFSSGVSTLVSKTNVGTSWTNIPTNSLSSVTLVPGESLYIRVYAYNAWDNFHLRFTENNLGPSIKGTVTTTCTVPGDQTTPGNGSWNGYVYTYTDNNTTFNTAATYVGTVTESANFEKDFGSGQVNGATRNIPCVTPPSDRFMVRYKMTTPSLAAGAYNFTVGGDDGYRLYIDGNLQSDLSNWADHGYEQKTKRVTLSAGVHNFIYEYYEKTGDARVLFSYGKVNDDVATPAGINVWNVYGYNSDTTRDANSLSGMYVDSNLNINTQNFWATDASPSAASGYTGAPIARDYFSAVFKRKGFPCGKYSMKLDQFDDDVVVILNGVQIESRTGTGSNYTLTNFILKPTDELEIRLVERGGSAVLKFSLTDVPTVYSASTDPSASDVAGTSMRVEKNMSLSSDLNVCSCTVVSGYTLTVPSTRTLVVQEGITVQTGATMTVENNASLVQVKDNAVNSGVINVKRTTTPVKRYDFTYWSSPVGSNFTLYNLSPNTLGDKYYSYNPVTGWVIHYNGAQTMEAGKGYLVRAPQEYDINNASVYNATFTGTPNNGIVNQSITAGAYNLIGNPYPSAISADAIYNANSAKITGTFYFWTHNSLPTTSNTGNSTYNYTSDDYASYNVVGGVKTKPATYGGTAPTGNIASGQAFFTIGSASGGNLEMKNAMRVSTSNSNSQFFRSANQTQSETTEEVTFEKHRLWLNISNESGDFNETLVGYVSTATNGMDDAFDGVTLSSGNARIYSIIDNNNLVIQGRSLPFTNQDIVPLGVVVATAGQYTINMDQFDGLFENQNIYLFDKSNDTYHDLKAGNFTFTTEAGTFNSRFEIRYVNDSTLGTDNPIVSQNDVVVYKSGNQIAVRANNLTIDTVQVYDITGKLITSGKNINNSTFSTTGLNVATQVLIVKVTLDDNQTVSKKVIMN